HNYVVLPDDLIRGHKTITFSLWFNARTGGVIIGYQASEALSSISENFVPMLYVGEDGKLRGQLYGGYHDHMISPAVVTDGAWHHVAIVAKEIVQYLYLDGVCIGTLKGALWPMD